MFKRVKINTTTRTAVDYRRINTTTRTAVDYRKINTTTRTAVDYRKINTTTRTAVDYRKGYLCVCCVCTSQESGKATSNMLLVAC